MEEEGGENPTKKIKEEKEEGTQNETNKPPTNIEKINRNPK